MNDTQKVFPGFWFGALLCLIVIAFQSLFIIPVYLLGMILGIPHLTAHPLVLAAVNVFAFAVALGAGWWIGRVPPREWLPLRRIPPVLYPVAILTCLGAVVLVSEVDNLTRSVFPMPKYLEEMFRVMFDAKGRPVAAFFLLVIVAPVTEELLFRGMILRGLRTRFRPLLAAAACALLFAVLHMNPWQFAGAFGLGLIFGWWLLRTHCLWLCLLGHAVANGSLLAAGWLPWTIPGLTLAADSSIPTGFQPWWLDLGALALLGLGLWLFHRLAPPLPPEPRVPPVLLEQG